MSLFVTPTRSWSEALAAFFQRPVLRLFFLGFAAGLPILLIFSTLSVWLREAGVERQTVTYFSWAALGYSFKFVWAPLVDRLSLGALTARLGRRRGWLLLTQAALIFAMFFLAAFDPRQDIYWVAAGAVMIGFASATQDIVIDAYRIEAAPPDLQSLMSSAYIAGYRVGMFVAGAGALWLAAAFGQEGVYDPIAWSRAYQIMGLLMLVGVATCLIMPEPAASQGEAARPVQDHLRFLASFVMMIAAMIAAFVTIPSFGPLLFGQTGPVTGFIAEALRFGLCVAVAGSVGWASIRLGLSRRSHIEEMYVAPLASFFRQHGRTALVILALIGIYRISDIVMGAVANVFYVDIGFTKEQIALWSKALGPWIGIAGGFLGGLMALRFGVMPILMTGAVVAAASNLLFVILAQAGPVEFWLAVAIVGDNMAGGFAGAAFVAYLSSLTDIRFTAMQYALFSSLMTLFPKVLGGYSGGMVDAIGYSGFFALTALLSIPVLVLIAWISRVEGLRPAQLVKPGAAD